MTVTTRTPTKEELKKIAPKKQDDSIYDGSRLDRGKSAGDRSKGPAPKKDEQKK